MLIPVSYRFYNFGITLGALFSGNVNMLLSSFGSSVTGANIVDDTGVLYVGEEVTVGGRAVTMVGSGTATPGVDIGFGLIVPLGASKDVIVFEDHATGRLLFAFPDGEPNFLGAIMMVLSVDEVGYNANTLNPVCFAAGTQISTPQGAVAVENLQIGDQVFTIDGQTARIRWISESRFVAPSDRAWPIEIEAGAFGQNLPRRRLRLSPQHRLCVPAKTAGDEMRLVPALTYVGLPGINQIQAPEEVRYVHFLVDCHSAVWAEGVACETLLIAPGVLRSLGKTRRAELAAALGYDEERLLEHPSAQACGRLLTRRDRLRLLRRRQKAGWLLCIPEGRYAKRMSGAQVRRPETTAVISRAAAR